MNLYNKEIFNIKDRVNANINDLKRKSKNAEYVIKARRNNKIALIMYKGGSCEKCGYNKPYPTVYHFHHKDRTKKEFPISRFMSRSLERLKVEVDKCSLFCANCHAETHDHEYAESHKRTIEDWSNWTDEEIKEKAKKKVRTRRMSICKQCKIEYYQRYSDQKYCSPVCRIESSQIVNKPSKKELIHLLKTDSWVSIASKFKVSDNTVRNWARRYDIEF